MRTCLSMISGALLGGLFLWVWIARDLRRIREQQEETAERIDGVDEHVERIGRRRGRLR